MTGNGGQSPPGDDGGAVPLEQLPLHSTSLLTVLDGDGIVQYESPAIERIYGYTQADLVGKQVVDYFHPDDREDVVAAFQRIVSSEDYDVEAVEYRHEQADGTYCWVESVASSNPTPEGYYVVNTRDISDQKARETELEDRNRRLEEFAQIVSHDLRNPLNIAAGELELARTECESEHLDRIGAAHTRMAELIDDLLTLARSGRGIDDLTWVPLGTVAESCWQTVVTSETTLEVAVDRTIRADPRRLKQLLENLFRNAIEHGGTDPTVTVGECDHGDGFYVADTGPGIPEAERETVFESGYTSTEEGTGLGLRIVEEIADAHDWGVRLTESGGGGARFEFTDVEFGP